MTARDILRVSVLLFAVATGFAFLATGLRVKPGEASGALISCAAGLIGCHFYKSGGSVRVDRIVTCVEVLSLLTLITVIGGAGSYASAAMTMGYHDSLLASADAMLGLNWLDYWQFVHSIYSIKIVLNAAYNSIIPFPAIMVALLALRGTGERAYGFLLAYTFSLALTVLIFFLVPAQSALPHFFGLDAPTLAPWQKEHIFVINELRTGQLKTVPLDHLIGLITFPSFHAASAILFIWASWRCLWLRVPSLAINVPMLLSTPVEGSHYFIDVIGGALVALVGIAAAEMTVRRRRRERNEAVTLSFT